MDAQLYSLTHGTTGLVLPYVVMLFAVVAGLIHARAGARKYLQAPVLAVGLLLVAWLYAGILGMALHAIGWGGGWIQVISGYGVEILVGFVGGVGAVRGAVREPEHRRGAFVSNAPIGIVSEANTVTLAGIPIPRSDETKHFKIIGSTGTGKSTAIREVLDAALSRGDRAIIADPDGGYLNRYYDPNRGDVILNPFHANAHKWNLFGEITENYDIDELARALIPDSGDEDRIWSEYARTLFSEVIRQMRNGDDFDDRELSRLLNRADDDELSMMLEDTAAARFFKEGNEKMLASTQSVLASAVKVFEYTTQHEALPLSIRAWVREGKSASAGGRGGVLFLPYKAVEIAALRRLISTWMRLSIFEAMNCEEGDHSLWFIVDELDALGVIDGLKDALARLRKFGGRCVLGFQSIAQASGIYGKGTAETIIENCGNTLILRCSASERGGTSEFASRLIGQRDVIHTTSSKSRRSDEWRSSTTKSEQLRTEPAVMASEIERLPDLKGFLKVASAPDWRVATLTIRPDPARRVQDPPPSMTAASPPPISGGSAAATVKEQSVPRQSPKNKSRKQSQSKPGRRKRGASPSETETGAANPPPFPQDASGPSRSDTPDPG